MLKNRVMTDSLALAIVRVLTMLVSIISTMILSRALPLAEYGTYSTGNLLITTATSLSALGLLDAVNYYYNGKSKDERKAYIDSTFAVVIFCGLIAGLIILVFSRFISNYFHNPKLTSIYIYIAFRPLISNLGLGFQNLQVSIGKAKIVAIRNIIISLGKLIAVIITAYYSHNITTVFIVMLVVEALGLVFYYKVLLDNNMIINPFSINFVKVKEILAYCIPMGIYIQTNALARDLDKFVIGYYESTDNLAIYTNCSTKLPFDIISASLLMVLIPVLTRCIKNKDYKGGVELFKSDIKIGYSITFAFGITVMALSNESIRFLYGDKYLPGIIVFILYVLVDMFNFVGFSIVLGAKGKTKTLMIVSSSALIVNLVLNFICYKFLGFIGPAVSTVIVTIIINSTLLALSARELKTNLIKLFDYKHLGILLIELFGTFVIISLFKGVMIKYNFNYVIILVLLGLFGVLSIIALNIKCIKAVFDKMNEISSKNTIE